MSDDVKALIAEARAIADYSDRQQSYGASRVIRELADALEAAQQAPAVDVDRAVKIIAPWFQGSSERLARKAIDFLIASGLLLGAAEVEARGLENAAEIAKSELRYPSAHSVEDWLRARAQQVREGN